MSDRVRITQRDLDERVANLNRRMSALGARVRYAVEGRNGYIGLDRYEVVDDGDRLAHCLSTVTIGTKREVAEFLHAMMVSLDDARIWGQS